MRKLLATLGILTLFLLLAGATANMGMNLPTVGSTPGPTWASMLNTAFGIVDSHDHTSGKGVQVPTAGLNINADLPLGNHEATGAKGLGMNDQGTKISSSTHEILYSSASDLWYNDGAGNQIQLTHLGVILTGLPPGCFQRANGQFVCPGLEALDGGLILGGSVGITQALAGSPACFFRQNEVLYDASPFPATVGQSVNVSADSTGTTFTLDSNQEDGMTWQISGDFTDGYSGVSLLWMPPPPDGGHLVDANDIQSLFAVSPEGSEDGGLVMAFAKDFATQGVNSFLPGPTQVSLGGPGCATLTNNWVPLPDAGRPLLPLPEGRMCSSMQSGTQIPDRFDISENVSSDGTNWNLDDVNVPGIFTKYDMRPDAGQIWGLYSVTAGSNPRTMGSETLNVGMDGLGNLTVNNNLNIGAAASPGTGSTLSIQASDSALAVRGNRSAAHSAVADVILGSQATRSAGDLVYMQNNTTTKWKLDYTGKSTQTGAMDSVGADFGSAEGTHVAVGTASTSVAALSQTLTVVGGLVGPTIQNMSPPWKDTFATSHATQLDYIFTTVGSGTVSSGDLLVEVVNLTDSSTTTCSSVAVANTADCATVTLDVPVNVVCTAALTTGKTYSLVYGGGHCGTTDPIIAGTFSVTSF